VTFRRRPSEGAASPFGIIVVGLGNPGKQYARTRHNVGEDVVLELARRCHETLRAGRDNALVAETRLGDQRVVLAFPLTYMNESGQAVGKLVRRYKVDDPARLIVVHDELDLAPGVVRVKVGGGLAGHNGLRSITAHTSTQDYVRVRIGVGKPSGGKERGADHVLSKVGTRERELLDVAIAEAADAVEMIVAQGPEAAMQTYNSRTPEP
jgi:peptidyl-tRNA hydrolase, PTH1 family